MKKTKGFTLIELMIVVAIIGILAAIAVPKFADLIRKSNEGATKGNLGAIRSAVSIYYGEQEGTWPLVTASGTEATAGTLGAILTTNNGMFIKTMPNCNTAGPSTWGHTSVTSIVTIGLSSADESAGPGTWGYQTNPSPAVGLKTTGDVWVNCVHTDTKNNVWASY